MTTTLVEQRASEVRSAVIASWVLLLITCGISLIPFLGFAAWLLGSVTIVIAIVLGIVVISKGGTWNGVLILLASLIGVPIFILVAPFVTTVLTGSALEERKAEIESEPAVEVIEEGAGVEVENGAEGTVPLTETSMEDSSRETKDAEGETDTGVKGAEKATSPSESAGLPPSAPSASGGSEQ